jgi:hypothetical protein
VNPTAITRIGPYRSTAAPETMLPITAPMPYRASSHISARVSPAGASPAQRLYAGEPYRISTMGSPPVAARRAFQCGGGAGMAVLIDPPNWPGPRGLLWSHLVSDVSLDELHGFAERLQVPRRAFDRDHYDVPETVYERAVMLGAEPVSSRILVVRLTAAGLRRRKTRQPG